jgi:hypothetical protein
MKISFVRERRSDPDDRESVPFFRDPVHERDSSIYISIYREEPLLFYGPYYSKGGRILSFALYNIGRSCHRIVGGLRIVGARSICS